MCTFVSSILYFSEWLRRVKTCFGWCRFDGLTLVLQCLGYLDRTLPDKQNSSRRWTFQRPATRWCENMQLPCIGNLMTLLGGIPWNCLTTDMQLKGRRTAVAKSFFVLLSFLSICFLLAHNCTAEGEVAGIFCNVSTLERACLSCSSLVASESCSLAPQSQPKAAAASYSREDGRDRL